MDMASRLAVAGRQHELDLVVHRRCDRCVAALDGDATVIPQCFGTRSS